METDRIKLKLECLKLSQNVSRDPTVIVDHADFLFKYLEEDLDSAPVKSKNSGNPRRNVKVSSEGRAYKK